MMYSVDITEGTEVYDSEGARVGAVAEVRLDPLTSSVPGIGTTEGTHVPGKAAIPYMHIRQEGTGAEDLWVPYDAIQHADGGQVRLIYTRAECESRYREKPVDF